MIKTRITSYRILLSDIHGHRTKLRHLQSGTTSRDEESVPLATIPRLDKGTIHNIHRSRKPHLLESPQESR